MTFNENNTRGRCGKVDFFDNCQTIDDRNGGLGEVKLKIWPPMCVSPRTGSGNEFTAR
jgi:hypothetical protein